MKKTTGTQPIFMKFGEKMTLEPLKKPLDFDGNPVTLRWG